MNLDGARIIITGAASGIGAALAERAAREGAAALLLADLDALGLQQTADACAAASPKVSLHTTTIDVAERGAAVVLCDIAVLEWGGVDLYCANAGIASGAGLDADDATWQRVWAVNTLSVVDAGRAMVQLARAQPGGAYLLVTASAAGLLTNLGDAPYTATKHAAVGVAEWIAITHAGDGLRVACLCPQGVRTPLVMGGLDSDQLAARVVDAAGLIEPDDVADAVVAGLASETFLILPHPEVARFEQAKAADRDGWLAGMRRLLDRLG